MSSFSILLFSMQGWKIYCKNLSIARAQLLSSPSQFPVNPRTRCSELNLFKSKALTNDCNTSVEIHYNGRKQQRNFLLGKFETCTIGVCAMVNLFEERGRIDEVAHPPKMTFKQRNRGRNKHRRGRQLHRMLQLWQVQAKGQSIERALQRPKAGAPPPAART
ncbi:hypothetical protein HAX54_049226 [Datura stramonium]|uniref:Uncharacterized protein n=1 Tax=Datura stramonium TaxID=4076 RepID=A0ABS8RQL8_DATST|nr:hypothetical protein [Datura stramonium]